MLRVALAAWFLAQGIKLLWHLVGTRKLDLRYFVSTGGFPSAHSAMVTGAAWACGILEGFNSPLFAIAAAFASIVMFDAQGVRWAASRQARLLNQIIDELFQGHPISDERLKELLGHTPVQVFAGAAIGIFTAWLMLGR